MSRRQTKLKMSFLKLNVKVKVTMKIGHSLFFHSQIEKEIIYLFSNDSEFVRKESNKQEQQDMVKLINAACYYVNSKAGYARRKSLIDTVSCQKRIMKE